MLCGLVFLAGILSLSLTQQSAATRDFIGYWAAGSRSCTGRPLQPEEVLRLEKAVGLGNLQIKITPSPPVGLALVLPLGFLGAKAGLVFWMIVELGCAALAFWAIWVLQGRPASRLHLFGFLFAPADGVFLAGQLGVFLLLGLALFLLWHDTRPFWAGAALLPMTPEAPPVSAGRFGAPAWVVSQRKPRLLGLTVAMAISPWLVLAFDPHVWAQYFAMAHAGLMQDRFAPTLSAYLREDLAPGLCGSNTCQRPWPAFGRSSTFGHAAAAGIGSRMDCWSC